MVVVGRWRVVVGGGDGRVGFSTISYLGGLGRVCLGEHTSEASSKELIACNALLRRLVEAATAAAGGAASALASEVTTVCRHCYFD